MAFRYVTIATLAAALAIAGCGGGGASGPTGPVTQPTDMTAVTGGGTSTVPYILPATVPDGTHGAMEDWYAAASGWWKITGSSIYANKAVDNISIASLTYHTGLKSWRIGANVGSGYISTPVTYDTTTDIWGATGWYKNVVSADQYTYLRIFDDDPAIGQYGSFGIAGIRYKAAALDGHTIEVFDFGLATDPAKMPTGTASYNGSYEVVRTGGVDGLVVNMFTGGVMTLNADFGAGTFLVTNNTPAAYTDGDTVALSGSGAISGNAISGASSAIYTDLGVAAYAFNGTVDGAFYGPAAEEVAGTFDLGSNTALDTADGSVVTLVGGFWGAK